jgi:hypothetical protein
MAQFGLFDSCAVESSEPHAAHARETCAPGRRESVCFLVEDETGVPPRPNQSPPSAPGARLAAIASRIGEPRE